MQPAARFHGRVVIVRQRRYVRGHGWRVEWGAKISRRFFCKTCGIHCFARGHLAEVGGDYVSINLNCIDDLDPNELNVSYWDGRHNNWHAGPRSTPWPISASSA